MWMDRSEMSSSPLWQNMRDSAAFSTDAGATWYFVDDRKQQNDEADKGTGALEAGE
jgi:hypothetical protein